MYQVSYFKEKDKQAVLAFIEAHPFAFLASNHFNGSPIATQVPFLLEEKDGELFLQAHIMRKTDHHHALMENPNALVVFTGPHAYVSASWYSSPSSGSTWNYMSVHVNGTVRFMTDEQLVSFMRKFTLKFEGDNKASQTIFDNLPQAYLDKMMPAIVGIEIKVEAIDNVFKLSQNKDEVSYKNIIDKLSEQGGSSADVAEEMKKRIN